MIGYAGELNAFLLFGGNQDHAGSHEMMCTAVSPSVASLAELWADHMSGMLLLSIRVCIFVAIGRRQLPAPPSSFLGGAPVHF